MNRLVASLVVACGLAGVASAPHAATVIDDFETQGFQYYVAGDTIQQDFIVSTAHAIWSPRHVTFSSSPGWTAGVTLAAGSQLDDEVSLYSPGTAWIEFDYDWGFPYDITEGGAVELLDIDCPMVDPEGDVVLTLHDADGDIYGRNLWAPQVGINAYDLPQLFVGIDLTRLTRLSVRFTTRGRIVLVADMRTRGSGRRPVNFTGNFVAIQTPPVPTPPLVWRIYDELGQGLYRSELAIMNIDAGYVPATRATWEETAGLGGEIAGTEFLWADPSSFAGAFFQLSLELRRAVAAGLSPEVASTPEVVSSAEGFLVTFPVELRDVGGIIRGNSEVRLSFDIGAGQPLTFANVQVAPAGAAGGGAEQGGSALFDGLDIAFELIPEGTIDEALPLFEATWTCDWWAATTVDVGAAAPPRPEGFTLAARPSVTRAGTEFHVSAPPAAAAAITIHDAAGRLVRSLVLPAGASAVWWDGRDGQGREAASGMYYARTEHAGGRAAARVVRVR